jgi:phosphomannomutase/phosphoglucomutase
VNYLPIYARLFDTGDRVDCPDDRKFRIAEQVRTHFHDRYETIDIDGVRVNFPEGWGLVRASILNPVLVASFRARTPEQWRISGVDRKWWKE